MLPHASSASQNTKGAIYNSDLIVAEVSLPSTGGGIELGWASTAGVPIVAFCRTGSKYSSSIEYVTCEIIEYGGPTDFIDKLQRVVGTCRASTRRADQFPDLTVRAYDESDFGQVAALYTQSALYGGVMDQNRDSAKRLRMRTAADPDAIWVAVRGGVIIGTVSLIEDGRVAWLFRFAVARVSDEAQVAKALVARAEHSLLSKGHHQVLVYTPLGNERLNARYKELGFTKGSDYTCYWKDLK